jgi:sporulation protein YlmC with PRC-barrel domain
MIGDYVGKIEEVILGENKIKSLKIKLDKRKKIKTKGIIVKYKNVKNVGHIVVVDEKIMEKFLH